MPIAFALPLPEIPVDQPTIIQSASLLLEAKVRLKPTDRFKVHVGVLHGDRRAPDIALFQNAVEELGGRVSIAYPNLSDLDTPRAEEMARMLGRLYMAVECVDLDRTFIDCIRRGAGIPVFDGLSTTAHWVAKAAEQVAGLDSRQVKQQALIQAYLLATVSC